MVSRQQFLLTAHRLGVRPPNAKTFRTAIKHRFQGVKKPTELMELRGVVIDKDGEFLYIITPEMNYCIPVGTPDLHTRIKTCVQLYLSSKGTAVEVLPDLPYCNVFDQVASVTDDLPLSNPECHKVLKDLREGPLSETTADYGEAFSGEYVEGDEVYVRAEPPDFEACSLLMEKYPAGRVYEEGDHLLFVYGMYRGASQGLCPPINPAVFTGATEPSDPSLDRLKAIGQEYKSLVAEQGNATENVSPSQLAQVQKINDWLNAQPLGHYFLVGVDGQLSDAAALGVAHVKANRFEDRLSLICGKMIADRERQFFYSLHKYNDAVGGMTKACFIYTLALGSAQLGSKNGKPVYDYNVFLYLVLRAAMRVYFIKQGRYVPKDASIIRQPKSEDMGLLDNLF